MGWTSYQATHYKNGKIDRKAECDSHFDERYKVLKSAMVGNVYYAAVQCPDGSVVCKVTLTSTNRRGYFNFSYKPMCETMGPCHYDCPIGILKLLTPTDSEWANDWRNLCWETIKRKKDKNSLKNLPVGSVISFTRYEKTVELTKCSPAHQFKHNWWYNASNHSEYAQKYIPKEYTVVKVG